MGFTSKFEKIEQMLKDKKITLIVTGSISAYKSTYLVRELVKAEAKVRVVMTKSACEFITPLTLQTLSGSMVATDMFDHYQEAEIGHIDLADNADLILIAPATANIIAKASNGIADDLASTVILASKAKKLFVPSMNVNMWQNEITQNNVKKLRSSGIEVMSPDSGELACGWVGAGRLPELENIKDQIASMLTPKLLGGKKVIITAGPTVEPIDPIRFVSNRSTGRMGYAIAKVAHFMGADVSLVSGPTGLAKPFGVNFLSVNTAEEMKKEVLSLIKDTAGCERYLFMVSAVTDHRPANQSDEKVKSDKSSNYNLEMEPCPDILKTVSKNKDSKTKIIGFCAETGDEASLLSHAKGKLKSKGCDLIVANLANESFARDTNRVWLVRDGIEPEELSIASKDSIAEKIISKAI